MNKTRTASLRLQPERWEKWRRVASKIGVSQNEAIGLLIDAINEEEVTKPVIKMNGAGALREAGAIR